MSITASEELLNRLLQQQTEGKNFDAVTTSSLMVRLTLEGCYTSFEPFTKTVKVRFNSHLIGDGPDNSCEPYLDALKFIVARERLKGKNVQH